MSGQWRLAMKKSYEKPTLVSREKLGKVTAEVPSGIPVDMP
jgi:hypothetical protein